jgi:hypothetical protein
MAGRRKPRSKHPNKIRKDEALYPVRMPKEFLAVADELVALYNSVQVLERTNRSSIFRVAIREGLPLVDVRIRELAKLHGKKIPGE